MKKRIFSLVAFWFIAFTFVLVKPAWAYIDPATTTYVVQIVAALVITLGVSLSIFLYRFKTIVTSLSVSLHALRRRIRRKFSTQTQKTPPTVHALRSKHAAHNAGIDLEEEALSAGLIDCPIPARTHYRALALPDTEPDLPDLADLADETAGDESLSEGSSNGPGAPSRLHRLGAWLWGDKRSFKQRSLRAGLIAGGLSMTFFIFDMLDSVIMNEAKLAFSLGEVIGPVLLVGLAFFVIATLLLSALRGRVFDLFICLTLSLLIGIYLQSTFFNASIGQLLGNPLWWNDLGVPLVIINLIVWIAVFVFVFVTGLKRKEKIARFFKRFSLFVPALIIVVQLIALFSILPAPNTWNENKASGTRLVLTESNRFQVSRNSNIIVFCLDTLDNSYIDRISQSDPSFFKDFDGFTRFTDTVAQYNSTFPAVISYMSGVPYDTTVTSAQYTDSAYRQSLFPADVHEQGYSVDLYMESAYMYADGRVFEGVADNLEYTSFEFDVAKTLGNLTKLSSLKSAPLALKFAFWLSTDTFSTAEGANVVGGASPYGTDDARFYQNLREQKLEVVNEPGHFAYYHLNGPHSPWNLDAQARYVEEGTSTLEQAKGSFFILKEYLQQMKDLGLYKDATIIIMGDHPAASGSTHLSYPMMVGLMVKPAGAEGNPLQTNTAPVALDNLGATCIAAAGGDTTQWGRTFFEIPEKEIGSRHYYRRIYTEGGRKHFVLHYLVTGDAHEWNNWRLLEEIPQETKNWF